jgi:hypothetical protein
MNREQMLNAMTAAGFQKGIDGCWLAYDSEVIDFMQIVQNKERELISDELWYILYNIGLPIDQRKEVIDRVRELDWATNE